MTLEEISKLLQDAEGYEDKAAAAPRDVAAQNYRKAATAYGKAAKLAEGLLGLNHEDTLKIRDSWAVSLSDSGGVLAAVDVNKENIERYTKTRGERDNQTLDARRRLAGNWLTSKDFGKAIPEYEKIVDIVTTAKKPTRVICQDRTDLAAALFESNSPKNVMRAIDLNVGTLQKAEQALGKDHFETITVRYNLGRELMKLSKYSDAAERFQENIKILQSKTCKARSHAEYASLLEDSEASLRRCSEKIARREKEAKEQREAKEERERQQREEKARLEKVRLEKIRVEMENAQKQKQEEERQRQIAEAVRRANAELESAAKERVEKACLEEKARQEKLELERVAEEERKRKQLEAEILERRRLRNEKQRREKVEAEKQEQERMERERLTKEEEEKQSKQKALVQERLLQERLEQDRVADEQAERARDENERTKDENRRDFAENSRKANQTIVPETSARILIKGGKDAPPPEVKNPGSVQVALSPSASTSTEACPSRFINPPVEATQNLGQGLLWSLGRYRAINEYWGGSASSLNVPRGVRDSSQNHTIKANRELRGAVSQPTTPKEAVGKPHCRGEKQRIHQSMLETGPKVETGAQKIPEIRTGVGDSARSEIMVPGGWHQDFDEPNERLNRRARSNENIGNQLNIASVKQHRRASSVDPPRAPMPQPGLRSSLSFFKHDADRADDWFSELETHAHALLDRYKDDLINKDRASRPVKVAVLDTGIAKRGTPSAPVPPLINLKGRHIKFGKLVDKSMPPSEDANGHGTHAAGLILTVCPYADVYVYRVLRGDETISPKIVTEALSDAIRKKVDIVSMSFGWEEDSDEELRAVIERAKMNNILLFAATSNDGIRTRGGMAFPARADEVIAVDAADGHGNPSKFNPPQGDKQRFTALGEAVNSAFPTHLAEEWETPGWRRMSGTSCATPIAAGIAGLILEFSRQRPLCYDPSVEERLKSVAGMREVFSKLFSLQSTSNSHFKQLDPNRLFCCTSYFPEGGDWCQNSSPRLNAANGIVECLRNRFSRGIGSLMNEKIQEEWRNKSPSG